MTQRDLRAEMDRVYAIPISEAAISNWKAVGKPPRKLVERVIAVLENAHHDSALGRAVNNGAMDYWSGNTPERRAPIAHPEDTTWQSTEAFMAAMPPLGTVLTAAVRSKMLRDFLSGVSA